MGNDFLEAMQSNAKTKEEYFAWLQTMKTKKTM